MEEENIRPDQESAPEERQPEAFRERPLWQIWGARIALVVFVLLIIMYYVNVARGGI